jgi:hypothetical protein
MLTGKKDLAKSELEVAISAAHLMLLDQGHWTCALRFSFYLAVPRPEAKHGLICTWVRNKGPRRNELACLQLCVHTLWAFD